MSGGILGTTDFGEIVFNLVENNLLAKTEKDTREDFAGGFDFEEAFTAPYEPLAEPKKKSAKSPKAKTEQIATGQVQGLFPRRFYGTPYGVVIHILPQGEGGRRPDEGDLSNELLLRSTIDYTQTQKPGAM